QDLVSRNPASPADDADRTGDGSRIERRDRRVDADARRSEVQGPAAGVQVPPAGVGDGLTGGRVDSVGYDEDDAMLGAIGPSLKRSDALDRGVRGRLDLDGERHPVDLNDQVDASIGSGC